MAKATKATPPAAAPSAPPAPKPGQVRVRMYRQGLGDCFLITLPRETGEPFHLLIDCGVILGTEKKAERMAEVVRSIARDTKGKIDVLAVTHEHYDHVSGFVLAGDAFSKPDEAPDPDKLRVGQVWFAWTENPQDKLGQKIREARAGRAQSLALLADHSGVQGVAPALAAGIGGLLSFFGVEGDGLAAFGAAAKSGSTPGATAQAMKFAGSLGEVRYIYPTDLPFTMPDLPAIRIWALGPPPDETLLKRTLVKDEVYHYAIDGAGDAVFGAAPLNVGGREDMFCPFDPVYSIHPGTPQAAASPGNGAAFMAERYFAPAQDWRRIDEDWLLGAAQLALQMDSATNNTSLVLAIEAVDTGHVLLFAADAQVGNWQSWQDLKWELKHDGDVQRVTGPDLLHRTIFYKVGHHGSHNATLRKGLEMMSDDLVAFIPVDQEMAKTKGWNAMPLQGLLDVLETKTGKRVVRLDQDLPPALAGAEVSTEEFTAKSGSGPDPLYYQWTTDFFKPGAPAKPAPRRKAAGS